MLYGKRWSDEEELGSESFKKMLSRRVEITPNLYAMSDLREPFNLQALLSAEKDVFALIADFRSLRQRAEQSKG